MNGITKTHLDRSVIERLATMGPIIDLMETLYKLTIVGNHEVVIHKDKLVIYWVEYKNEQENRMYKTTI